MDDTYKIWVAIITLLLLAAAAKVKRPKKAGDAA